MGASRCLAVISALLALPLWGVALAAGPFLEVTSRVSLADAPVAIRATGLRPGSAATIAAFTRDASGDLWESSATCTADRAGVVDLRHCMPATGALTGDPALAASTYAARDGMGLFWSMRQRSGPAFFFQFPSAPSAVYELELVVDGSVVRRTVIERQLMADGVRRIQLTRDHDGIVGVAFEPAAVAVPARAKSDASRASPRSHVGTKRYPAVILVSGSGGGHQLDQLAAMLASHGYVTLSLAYYIGYSDVADLPRELLNIPLETVDRGLKWLKGRADVDASRIAIIGHSRGSELALLSAASYPQIKAAVVLAGSPVAWPGNNPRDYTHDFPAWTLHGKPVPFLPSATYFANAYLRHRPLITAFEQALDNTAAVDAAFIPIELTHGPVLFLGGDADALWPSKRMAEMAMAYLHRHHHPFDDQMQMFPDAGHWFFEPYAPVEHRVTWRIETPQGSFTDQFGGTLEGDARAAPLAWAHIVKFMHAALGGSAPH